VITFDRIDCKTITEVRHVGRLSGYRTTNWRRIAAKIAMIVGTYTVWRCDDTMVVYLKVHGKVVQRSHKPNTWRFA